MPLNFGLQQAPMAFGLAEGVDPHQAPFGTLMTAENVHWSRTGRIEKRHGYTALAHVSDTNPNASSIIRIFARGNELSAIDSNAIHYTLSNAGTWTQKPAIAPSITVTTESAWDTVQGTRAGDVCSLSDGTVVYAWITGNISPLTTTTSSIFIRTVDPAGNETMQAQSIYTGTARHLRLLANGSSFMVLYSDNGGLYSWISGTTTTLKTDLQNGVGSNQGSPFDAKMMGSTIVVVYGITSTTTGGLRACQYSFATTPVLGTTTTVAGETSSDTPAIGVDVAAGDNLYIVYVKTTGTAEVRFTILDASTFASVVPVTVLESPVGGFPVQATVVRTGAGLATAVWLSAISPHVAGDLRACTISSSVPIVGGKKHVSGCSPVSKPWQMGGYTYILATNALDILIVNGGDAFVLDITCAHNVGLGPPPREAAKVELLTGGEYTTGSLAQVVPHSTVDRFGWISVIPFVSSASGVNNTGTMIRQGGHLVFVSQLTTLDTSLRPVTLGPEVYLSGGVISSYDGDAIIPAWSAFPPYMVGSGGPVTTGGTLAAGTYVVNMYTERRNFAGVLHRGPTAISRLFTTTGTTSSIPLVICPVWVGAATWYSGYGSDILVPIYVSQVGQSIPQRLTLEPDSSTLYNTYVVGSELSFTITAPVPASRPALYTASGELDDYQPPASLFLALHQNRLWSIAPDGHTVWFSKDVTLNPGVAPGFNPAMVLSFADPIVALASMDSVLIAFTSIGIYAISGSGPAPNGQGASYQADKVQTDVGCPFPRSVVSTPDGIMFASTRGIYIIDRNLGVAFIGKPVQDQTSGISGAQVTNAVLVSKYSEVRFAMNTGKSVVYNYMERQWSTAAYSTGGAYGRVLLDACLWNGAYTFLSEDGTICVESSTSYLDDTSYVPMTIETAWNNAAGPLAYQSVRNFSMAGFSNSDHDLSVSVAFNNESAYTQTHTWVAGSAVTAVGPLEGFDLSIGPRRKCQSIRFKVVDASPSGPYSAGAGQGPSFDTMGIEVGVINKGFAAKPAGKTA